MEKHLDLLLAEYNILETERLILRPINLSDVDDVFEYINDEEVTRFITIQYKTKEECKKGIASYFMKYPQGKYGIELIETQKLIGSIDLRVDQKIKMAEIGYVLHKQYWGNGYMLEAVQKLLEFSFNILDLIRVFACCEPENIRSSRVMQKAGMNYEGTLKKADMNIDRIIDISYYALLKEEYIHKY